MTQPATPTPTWRHRIIFAVAWILGIEVVQEPRPDEPHDWWLVNDKYYGGKWMAIDKPPKEAWPQRMGPFTKTEAMRRVKRQ